MQFSLLFLKDKSIAFLSNILRQNFRIYRFRRTHIQRFPITNWQSFTDLLHGASLCFSLLNLSKIS